MRDRQIASFIALGDSFTEGLNDVRADGTMAGWADRFADRIAHHVGDLRYANLAVRGRLLNQVLDAHCPSRWRATRIRRRGNDILRVGSDPDDVPARYAERRRGIGTRPATAG